MIDLLFQLEILQMSKNRKIWLNVILAIVGAIAGFFYWKLIGCTSGACPMQSVWYFPTMGGMALGYLLGYLTGSLIWRRAAENE